MQVEALRRQSFAKTESYKNSENTRTPFLFTKPRYDIIVVYQVAEGINFVFFKNNLPQQLF
jgi:hypothetical protein